MDSEKRRLELTGCNHYPPLARRWRSIGEASQTPVRLLIG